MSDKHENIEDFVRKVVDQSEAQIPFNESHWQQMESMLEAELPVVSNPGTGYYYFSNVVSLLVGAVFVWLWFTGKGTDTSQFLANQDQELTETLKEAPISQNSTSEIKATPDVKYELQSSVSAETETSEVEKVNPLANERPEESTSDSEASTIEAFSSNQVETSRIQNIESTAEKQNTRPGQLQSDEKVDSNIVVSSLTDNAEAASENSNVISTDSPAELPPSKTIVEEDQTLSSREDNVVVPSEEDEVISVENFNTPSGMGIDLSGDVPSLPRELAKVEVFEPDGGSYEQSESPIVNGSSRGPFSRFSVSVSLAPDLSSNQIFRYNRLGRDLGIVVDYFFTPRLSVSVGAFNTSKRYLVGGEEYNPPAGFWGNVTNGELPAKIDAKCQVLDIPINLKYQLISRPKFNIAASAGVSSYIMLKEDYQYELDNGWQSEWGTRNENQHFFGVGNLQIHIERRFGKHFAFEVAPFFKVPLTSYGHGNIRFHSMGSFFTLRKYFLTR